MKSPEQQLRRYVIENNFENALALLQKHKSDPKFNIDARFLFFGETALQTAVRLGNRSMCSLLITNSANKNIVTFFGRNTLLHSAAMDGFSDVCECLVKHQVPIDAENIWGSTAIFMSAYYNHDFATEYLAGAGAGADVNIAQYTGLRPLDVANEQMRPILRGKGAVTGREYLGEEGEFPMLV